MSVRITNSSVYTRSFDAKIFAFFSGVLATIWYYNFGQDYQIEQLPIILRIIDPAFLESDFFTNANAGFGPRYYYAHLLAFLGRYFYLPFIIFVLTLLSNICISFISFITARRLFNTSDLAGVIASLAVMSVSTIGAGSSPVLYTEALVSFRFALPLVMTAFYLVLTGRVLLAGLLCGIASIIHPVFGPGSGVLIFAAGFFANLEPESTYRQRLTESLTAGFIVIAFSLASIIPYYRTLGMKMDTSRFIEIVAAFRHPHHFLPSSFLQQPEFSLLIAFLVSAALVFLFLRNRSALEPGSSRFILLFAMFIALLCVAGYVFVELIPLRIMTTIQTFRYLNLLKWVVLLLFSGWTAEQLQHRETRNSGILFSLSMLSPITMLISSSSRVLGRYFRSRIPLLAELFRPALVMIPVLYYLIVTRSETSGTLFGIYFILLLFYLVKSRSLYYVTMFIVIAAVVYSNVQRDVRLPLAAYSLQVELEATEFHDSFMDVAMQCELRTVPGALFLTPPNFGPFRYMAKRAIVVDYQAFPFQEQAILEWYERVTDSYGVPGNTGIGAYPELHAFYRKLDDQQLEILADKYDIDFAILYNETETDRPVLYSNMRYKVIPLR